MTLTSNPDTRCGAEFVNAMRPIGQDNVDRPDVKPNLLALGKAVHTIATVWAETVSDDSKDPAFWTWVNGLTAWAAAMEQWRVAAEAALGAALPPVPPPPVAAPTEARGRIE